MSIDWTQFYYLVFYFILYSIAGWTMESAYRSICEKKLINSGFMYGPYCPIYGFGTIIMIYTLKFFAFDITLLFVASFVILTVWEYIVGVYLEKVYHAKYWDYSDHKININGRVCLLNSIYWGILGVVFIKLIHPFVSLYVTKIPSNIVLYLDLAIGIIMVIDSTISSIKTQAVNKQLEKLRTLTETLKEKLSKLKNETKKSMAEKEVMQLQLQQNQLKMKLYNQLTRMKNAFPNIKFEPINKFFSEKIDINEINAKIKKIREKLKKNEK